MAGLGKKWVPRFERPSPAYSNAEFGREFSFGGGNRTLRPRDKAKRGNSARGLDGRWYEECPTVAAARRRGCRDRARLADGHLPTAGPS